MAALAPRRWSSHHSAWHQTVSTPRPTLAEQTNVVKIANTSNRVLTSPVAFGIFHPINGLVTRCSSVKRNRKPIGERASSKLRCPVTAGSYAATKPKARSPMGFLLSAVTLVWEFNGNMNGLAQTESHKKYRRGKRGWR